jgi:hypothetical protein
MTLTPFDNGDSADFFVVRSFDKAHNAFPLHQIAFLA